MRKNRLRGRLTTWLLNAFARDKSTLSIREDWYQLDVKTTSARGTRVRNRRQKALLVKIAALTLLGISATLGVRWAYVNVFYRTDTNFQLTKLDIATDGAMTESQISEAAELSIGMNLMEIDLDEVKQRIESQPLVLEAEIGRELPDRMSIRVTERKMVAWLSCPPHGIRARSTKRGFLIDSEGTVLELRTLSKEFLPLPVIETWRMPKPEDGAHLVSESILSAIDLISESNHRFEDRGIEVVQITLQSPWSMRCLYSNDLNANFSREDTQIGLENLTHILNHAAANGLQLATVDLMMAKNIPVTYFNPPNGNHPGNQMDPSKKSAPGSLRDLPVDSSQPIDPQIKELRSILNRG